MSNLDQMKEELKQHCFDLIFMEEVQRAETVKWNPETNMAIYDLNIRSLSRSVRRDMREYGEALRSRNESRNTDKTE